MSSKTDFVVALPLKHSELKSIPHIASITTVKIHTQTFSAQSYPVYFVRPAYIVVTGYCIISYK
jgi:hypothetical protein